MTTFTVLDNIVACGISNANGPGNLTTSPAQRIATEMFDNDFDACINMSDDDIKSYLKTFSELPQAQSQVRLMPGAQRNLKAFVQHICHRIRQHLRPSTVCLVVRSAQEQMGAQRAHFGRNTKTSFYHG